MKNVFSFGFAFFIKTLVPGFWGSLCLFPIYWYFFNKMMFQMLSLNATFLITTIGLSIFFLLIDDFIYKLYEGFYWPKVIRNYRINLLNKKISKKHKKYKQSNDYIEKLVLNDWLMTFPIRPNRISKKPRTEAVLPTRLGNILKAYEDYPFLKYKISSPFYWSRFWITIDKDERKEIETIWAKADCLIYMSFISLLIAMCYVFFAVLDQINILQIINKIYPYFNSLNSTFVFKHSVLFFLLLSAALFLLSCIFYKLSIPHHINNGLFYQAIFDIHRDMIRTKLEIKEGEFDFWHENWSFLKYNLIKCDKCGKYNAFDTEGCSCCEK